MAKAPKPPEPRRGRDGIKADTKTDGTKVATGLTGPALQQFWDEFDAMAEILRGVQWTFARSMPWNPHWYTRRVHWDDENLFKWVVTELRLRGYRANYGKAQYTQLNLNDHFYWTMGNLMDWPDNDPLTPGARMTAIINRKHIYASQGYAPVFDSKEWDSRWLDREWVARVFGAIGDLSECRVLDVGCGDGHALHYAEHAQYLGLDPSLVMLNRLRHHWPWIETMCTPLLSFAAPHQFDRVLVLFGTSEFLTPEELARVPLLVEPGGSAWVMTPASWLMPGYVKVEEFGDEVLWRYPP